MPVEMCRGKETPVVSEGIKDLSGTALKKLMLHSGKKKKKVLYFLHIYSEKE